MTTTEPILYDTMYKYTNDADITHYKHSNADLDAPEILIEAFKPIDDPDFCVDWTNRLTQNGHTYIRVCWGEPEKSYLAEEAVFDCCYVRYTFFDEDDGSDYGEYVSDGRVYETREAAEIVEA